VAASPSFAADDAGSQFISQGLQTGRGFDDHAVAMPPASAANSEDDGLTGPERFIANVLVVRAGSASTPAAASTVWTLSETAERAEDKFVTYVLLLSTTGH
jgi:hypothetical protein